MIVTRRLIPRVSAAALVLGGLDGCGGDGGGDPGNGFERACRSFQRCEPADFAADYDSIGECVVGYEAYYAYYGDDCVPAYEALLSCIADLQGSSCAVPDDVTIISSCSSEIAGISNCGE